MDTSSKNNRCLENLSKDICNCIYNFIITPKKGRYNNEIEIGDKTLIINANIEDHKMVSRHAVVVSTPLAYCTDIKVGDEIIIHHNIFRRWYDIKGKERNPITIQLYTKIS